MLKVASTLSARDHTTAAGTGGTLFKENFLSNCHISSHIDSILEISSNYVYSTAPKNYVSGLQRSFSKMRPSDTGEDSRTGGKNFYDRLTQLQKPRMNEIQ